MTYRTIAELEAGLALIQAAPADRGMLRMIVRRPSIDGRQVLEEGVLDTAEGLRGDSWNCRRSSRTIDGRPHPEMQLTLMSVRVIDLLAGSPERWPLAGDQLYVDLDLSRDNLPPGTQLAIGDAIIEVSQQPHTGCQKFIARFGLDAMKFVSSPTGKQLNLRGINARLILEGRIRAGDVISKTACS